MKEMEHYTRHFTMKEMEQHDTTRYIIYCTHIYHKIDEFPDEWINAKTSHSQVLYKKYQGQIEDKPQKSIEDLVPQELHEYLTVFSEEAASRFPERKPWDHKILLKKDFKPRKGKIYDLSPEEDILLQEFIQENSKKGTKKKRPCQDYQLLNEGTIKDAYPLPQISSLINKL